MSKPKAEALPDAPHYAPAPEFEFPEGQKAEIVRSQPGPVAVTPMRLLEIATSQNADVDKLAKLLDLQERWERNEAKKAYVSAMKAFKADLPEITRNRVAQIKENFSYDYATLDNVCDKIAPALSKYGLTHRWKMSQSEGKIRVTCVITHEMGHSEEESTLEAGADTSGGKNAIQAVGSTVTYLERYTLLAACGIAVKGQDTDSMPPMPGIDEALKAIADAPDTSALNTVYRSAAQKAMLAKNGQAVILIAAARDKRKKELEGQ